MARTNPRENLYLQQEIDRYQQYSTVYLSQELNERDVEFVVQEALMTRQCRVLQLTRYKVTSAGASILAKALSTNENNLKILNLTTHRISNVGVEYLAEMIKTDEISNQRYSNINQCNTILQ
ncbi:hypothetical protein I4U23_022488 [Adineta vaga]|nr:hypothetical protein I4U23_022488 [Adineta vaga]